MDRAIAIIGPTASGKTGLALELAERSQGSRFEVISADSRQVYRHMDIGTAKPTPDERERLPHHLVDIIDPDAPFSLATWLELAGAALAQTWGRGHVPLIVGGTGQYVWALLEGWRVPQVPPQEDLRRELEGRPVGDLLEELRQIDPETHATIQPNNARRIIRALEVYQVTGEPLSRWRIKDRPPFEWLAIAPRLTRDELYARIDSRVEAMIQAGFVEEVERLLDMGYGRDLPSMSSIGYGEVCEHLSGEITIEEAIYRTKVGTHRLARHQNAWFKTGDERIRWIDPADASTAADLVEEFIR